MEQRLSDRITCVEANGRLEIRIWTRKNWWLVTFLPVWWIGWTAGGIAIFVALILGNPLGGALFSVIWLIMWVFSWAFTAYAWLWNAFGREIVVIDSRGLAIKRDVFGMVPQRRYHLTTSRNCVQQASSATSTPGPERWPIGGSQGGS